MRNFVEDDLAAARGIAIALPLGLLIWGLLIIGILWWIAPAPARTADAIVADWAGKGVDSFGERIAAETGGFKRAGPVGALEAE